MNGNGKHTEFLTQFSCAKAIPKIPFLQYCITEDTRVIILLLGTVALFCV